MPSFYSKHMGVYSFSSIINTGHWLFHPNNITKQTSTLSTALSSVFILFASLSVAQAVVPASKTFKFTNAGELGEYIVEYQGDYRPLDIYASPFQFCFYNTTPNAFTLALRMGTVRSESLMRWVWEANRGNPVRENATLTFGTDGNLILTDADGRIAWQTATANKGVLGLKLMSNGNLVLYNKKGGFVWQSFDYPTDTLLVGQSLQTKGPSKLVSRVSDMDGSPGPYSLVFEQGKIFLYLKSKNSPKPMLYYSNGDDFRTDGTVQRIVFTSTPTTGGAYELAYELFVGGSNTSSGSRILTRPKYNATLSMLRLGSDGSLKIYTYENSVDGGAWEVTYSLFDRNHDLGECKLPKKCGSLGVCEDNQCVACPTPRGLVGWSKTCEPPRLASCKAGASVNYYKVVGVEHFMNQYTEGDGPMKLADCRANCNKDCGCLGFFYREESSKCLLAPELDTLSKVSNQTHVAYIKMSK